MSCRERVLDFVRCFFSVCRDHHVVSVLRSVTVLCYLVAFRLLTHPCTRGQLPLGRGVPSSRCVAGSHVLVFAEDFGVRIPHTLRLSLICHLPLLVPGAWFGLVPTLEPGVLSSWFGICLILLS